jgi:hypothetical protein
LLGRIGSGQPFAIGGGGAIKVDAAGELALGTNDNNFTDNSGAWSAVVTPAASAPSGASADTQNATGGGSLAVVALGGVVVVAALAALFVFLRKRAAREPVFDLSDTLRVGRIDVRITRDGTVWRIDRTGEQQQFVPFASDFGLVGTAGKHGTFSWRGLQFRAVRSHGRFGRGHGEARMPGQYAAASAGMILDPRGYTEGVLPLSLPGAWVFTLVSVDTGPDSDENTHRASANGHLTMFIRDDQPFRSQADELIASFRAFLDDLDRLLAEREAKRATAARTEVAAAVE